MDPVPAGAREGSCPAALTDYVLLLRRKTPEPSSLAFEEWAPVYAFAQFLAEKVRPLLAARAVNVPYPRLLQIAGASPRGATLIIAGKLQSGSARLPELYLGDSSVKNLERLANSDVAAWLDETHYAYVTTGTALPELVVRALPDHAERQRFPLSNLWPLAGRRDRVTSAGYTTFIPFEDESCLFSTWLRSAR